jgi:hypothetical protein
MVIQIEQKEVVLVRHTSIPTLQWDTGYSFQVGQQRKELLILIHDMEHSWVRSYYRDQPCCGLRKSLQAAVPSMVVTPYMANCG